MKFSSSVMFLMALGLVSTEASLRAGVRRRKIQNIRSLQGDDDDDDGGKAADACGDEGKGGKGGKGGNSGDGGGDASPDCDESPTAGDEATSESDEKRTISGAVLVDLDNDNIGDEGRSGVTVQLLDMTGRNIIATTITDATGAYSFTVEQGSYQLREPQNPPDAALDVDGPPSLITTFLFDKTGNDFIDEPERKITGSVMTDEDGDSKGDTPSPGVLVELLDPSGKVVSGMNTLSDGSYEFVVPPGNYRVRETINPDGYALDVTVNDLPVDVNRGDSSGNDFVDAAPAADPIVREIVGTVWSDTDNDDTGDQPMRGSTVKLIDSTGATVSTTTVDSNGGYKFEVSPGTYTVEEVNPPDYIDVSSATVPVDVTDASSYNNDFVNEPLRVVSGFARIDTNGDGKGDDPIPDHLIELLQDGKVFETTETGPAGFYSFMVPPGLYVVEEPANPLAAPMDVSPNKLDVDVTTSDSKQNNFVDEPEPSSFCRNTKRGDGTDEGCNSATPICVDESENAIPENAEGAQCIACKSIPDIDVCLVLDESGSITGDEWLKQVGFTTLLIDGIASEIDDSDFDVSTFSTTARHIKSNLSADEAKSIVENHSRAGGFTATGAGIRTCIEPLDDQPNDNMFLILLTDGKPNRPKNNGESDALSAANTVKNSGVTLIPIAVGDETIGEQLDPLASPGYEGIRENDFAELERNSAALVEKIVSGIKSKCVGS